MTLLNLALLLLLAAIWGGSYLFLRIAAPVLGAVPLIAVRVTLAALTLLLTLAFSRARPKVRAYWKQYLLLGLLNNAIPFTLIATAVIHLNASISSILNATTPLFTALAVAIADRKSPTPRVLAGVLAGMAGVVVLMGWSPLPIGTRTVLAALAALAAAASYGAAAMYARRAFRDVPPLHVAAGQLTSSSFFMLPLGLVFHPASLPPLGPVFAAVGLAVVCTAFAYVLYFRLISAAGATSAATVTFLIPFFSLLWGVLALGEPVSVGIFVGLAVILASVWLVLGSAGRRKRGLATT